MQPGAKKGHDHFAAAFLAEGDSAPTGHKARMTCSVLVGALSVRVGPCDKGAGDFQLAVGVESLARRTGEVMTVTENDHAGRDVPPDGEGQQPIGQSEISLPGSGRTDSCTPTGWEICLCLGEHLITRRAYRPPLENSGVERIEVIWPAWPATTTEEAAVAVMPLADLQRYWSEAGNRLRDSAKWMATVLGAAIAAVIGTTPLASLRGHHLQLTAALIGLAGLILLGVTMLLILQVMRPDAVSYEDVQNAHPPA